MCFRTMHGVKIRLPDLERKSLERQSLERKSRASSGLTGRIDP